MFWNKPKAIIVVNRMTGQQEQASITVNSYSLDSKELYKSLKAAADALQERLVENNMVALEALKETVPPDSNVLEFSKYKKHTKKEEDK